MDQARRVVKSCTYSIYHDQVAYIHHTAPLTVIFHRQRDKSSFPSRYRVMSAYKKDLDFPNSTSCKHVFSFLVFNDAVAKSNSLVTTLFVCS